MIQLLYNKKLKFELIKNNENKINDLFVIVCLNVLLEEFNQFKDNYNEAHEFFDHFIHLDDVEYEFDYDDLEELEQIKNQIEKYTNLFDRKDMMNNQSPASTLKKVSKKYLKNKNNG